MSPSSWSEPSWVCNQSLNLLLFSLIHQSRMLTGALCRSPRRQGDHRAPSWEEDGSHHIRAGIGQDEGNQRRQILGVQCPYTKGIEERIWWGMCFMIWSAFSSFRFISSFAHLSFSKTCTIVFHEVSYLFLFFFQAIRAVISPPVTKKKKQSGCMIL